MSFLDSDERIIRYLLNEMKEEERSRFDKELLVNASLLETVASVEDEMIVLYINGELEPDRVPRFEEVYMGSPARRERVEAFQLLRKAVKREAVARRRQRFLARHSLSGVRFALIVSAVALLVLVVTYWPRGNSVDLHKNAAGQGSEVAFLLEPGRERGAAATTANLSVPPGTTQVRFNLKTQSVENLLAYGSYQVVLGTPERPEVWNGPAVTEKNLAVVIVPAALLAGGDYTLRLEGVSPAGMKQTVATYFFRVASNRQPR